MTTREKGWRLARARRKQRLRELQASMVKLFGDFHDHFRDVLGGYALTLQEFGIAFVNVGKRAWLNHERHRFVGLLRAIEERDALDTKAMESMWKPFPWDSPHSDPATDIKKAIERYWRDE